MANSDRGAWTQLSAGFWWAIGTAIAYGLLVFLTNVMATKSGGEPDVALQGGAVCSISKPWA